MILRNYKEIDPEDFYLKDNNEIPIANVYDRDDVPTQTIWVLKDGKLHGKKSAKNDLTCLKCGKQFKTKNYVGKHKKICPKRNMEHTIPYVCKYVDIDSQFKIKSQLPNPELRDICYVSGAFGSGKSTYTKNYIREFLMMFGEHKDVVLISRIEDDDAFQDMIEDELILPFEINDYTLTEEPLGAKEDLNNTLTIFDDVDLCNKKIEKSIQTTIRDVMMNGRDQSNSGKDIYSLITSHMLTNGMKTRDIINEASSITFFPRSGSQYHIERLLKVYMGFNKKMIKYILGLESRWVTIYKRYPMWVLHEKGAFMADWNIEQRYD